MIKKREIKERVKAQALEKARLEIKERLHDKATDFAKDKLRYKLEIQAREHAIEQFRSDHPQIASLAADEIRDRISDEVRDRAVDALHDRIGDVVRDEIRDKIKDELRDRAEYRSELIKAKIQRIGEDQFHDLKVQYKEKIRDKAHDRFLEIKSKIKSQGLVDQVEDGSYYGGISDIPETDLITYVFDFRGDAVKYSNPDIVKDVTGNIVMELVDLGDVNAKLRIVGGDFTVIGIFLIKRISRFNFLTSYALIANLF